MIHAVALDDEPPALDIIKAFCDRLTNVALQKTFTRTTEALEYIATHKPSLLLLDINMPSLSGIEFYRKLPEQVLVIFTTSYTEYAVESYALQAVDYLVKPFTFNRFSQAIAKADELYQLRQLAKQTGEQYLTVRVDYGLVKLAFSDIEFIEGLDNYLKIHLKNSQPVVVRMTMKALQEKLPAPAFIRVHRSYIVAMAQVKACRNKLITLLSDEEIPLGNSYDPDFQQHFHG